MIFLLRYVQILRKETFLKDGVEAFGGKMNRIFYSDSVAFEKTHGKVVVDYAGRKRGRV